MKTSQKKAPAKAVNRFGMSTSKYEEMLKNAKELQGSGTGNVTKSGNKGQSHVYTDDEAEIWKEIKLDGLQLSARFSEALEAGFMADFEASDDARDALFFQLMEILNRLPKAFPRGYKKKAANAIQPILHGAIHITLVPVQISDDEFKFVTTKLEPSFSTTVARMPDLKASQTEGKAVTVPLPGSIIGFDFESGKVEKA